MDHLREIQIQNKDKEVIALALVDEEDFDRVNQYKWHMHTGYAVTHIPHPLGGWVKSGKILRRKRLALGMHRLILGLDIQPMEIDHVDRNRLNNSKHNLRICSTAENRQNQPPQKGKTSIYRGVAWHKASNKWRAYGQLNGKHYQIGVFYLEEDAAKAASEWRAQNLPFSEDALL